MRKTSYLRLCHRVTMACEVSAQVSALIRHRFGVVRVVGAGMGLLIGHVIDQVDGFRRVHDTTEVARLVDGSAINRLVIAELCEANVSLRPWRLD